MPSSLLGAAPGSNLVAGDIAEAIAANTNALAPNCVQFIGTDGVTGSAPHIEHGLFWLYSQPLGTDFFWEFWVRPGIGASPEITSSCDGYFVSTSEGGAHRILVGFSALGRNNLWRVAGNLLLSNATIISYSSVDGVAAGEWVHVAVLADQDGGGTTHAQVFINGKLAGGSQCFTAASGLTFQSPGPGTGYNALYIGHSNHQNAKARLAALRAFDRVNPMAAINTNFLPQRAFGNAYINGARASLLSLYNVRGTVPDLSDGYDRGSAGAQLLHFPGVVANGAGDGYAFPEFVDDDECPYGTGGDLDNVRGLGSASNPLTVPATPVGAKVYDSFNRAPQEWIWKRLSGPTIGPPDFGSVTPSQGMVGGGSPLPSPSSSQVFEIRNGSLRCIPAQPCVLWWDGYAGASVVQDVRATRMTAAPGGNAIGVVIRCSGVDDFIGACIGANTSSGGTIFLADYVNGANTLGFTQQFNPVNTAWTILRLTVDALDVVRLYVDDGAGGWEQWPSTYTDTTHVVATGAGVGANLVIAGQGSFNADDVVVL